MTVMRFRTAPIVIIVALTLSACSASTADQPATAVQVPLASAALPTPTATITPTPTPTPTPTLSTTPIPSPSLTGDDAAYTAFIDRSGAFGTDLTPIEGALNAALSNNDLDKYVAGSRSARTLALKLVDWLDAHPPRACYKQMWTLTRAGGSDYASGRGLFIKYATVSFKEADARKGGELINTSDEDFARASSALMDVRCTK